MANVPLQLDDDLEVVERRTDVRIVLSLPGRFTLASRRDLGGQRREHPCRVINMSCHAVTLATPVAGEKGERVIAHVDEFGKLEGPIIRVMDGGFVMEIIAPKQERYRLAARIEWYEKHKNHDIEDHRQSVRIIPKNPYSTLVLADGTTIDCLVKDVSASGIAVSATSRRPSELPSQSAKWWAAWCAISTMASRCTSHSSRTSPPSKT